jgi:hypothetical protein
MGCKNSTSAKAQPEFVIDQSQTGKGKGKGAKGGQGKGKGKGAKINTDSKFQIELQHEWKDYEKEEDGILKRAYLVGQPSCKYQLRGQTYEYSFFRKEQKNLGTSKVRKIRPPFGMTQPQQPLLPAGAMIVIVVPEGGRESCTVKDPHNPGKDILVALPPRAKPGSKLAVPVPAKGEDIAEVVKRQKAMSTGSKMAIGMAAVGATAVGGVVLGEHLTGGALSSWAEASPELDAAGDWVAGAAGDVTDWAGGAADWAADVTGDAGDWVAGAAEDAGDWASGPAGDIGDWATDAADDAADWAGDAVDWGAGAIDDVGDWLGGAGDDVGDFVTSLF